MGYFIKMSIIYSPEEDSYLLENVLLNKVPKLIKFQNNLNFLEIGIGSGIQLKAASKAGINKENILGVDINPLAVKECKKLNFNCKKSNLFEKIKGKFDIIVFNPPYLPEEKGEDEESKIITTGGKKGSELINEFLKEAKNHIKPKGRIFLVTSSLTKKINWLNYKKRKIAEKKIFFERLFVWEISL